MTTVVCKFAELSSMTAADIGPGSIAVPGRHEARALTDACPHCMEPTSPAFVLDQDNGRWRLAAYQCPRDAAAWLCSWLGAREAARLARNVTTP